MLKIRIQNMKRLFTGMIAIALVLGVFLPTSTASAATMAELQAMIASLQAQLSAMNGGSMTGAQAQSMFNTDLTIGSKNSDVSSLQALLISKGYSIPAGATGYFGAQTRSAVAAWQAASGIMPAVGYFGPKSRAAINAMSMTTTTTTTTGTSSNCPAGYTCTSTTGGATMNNNGVEGIITVDLNPTPGSGNTLHENDRMANFIGIRIKAQQSDLKVQRVKLDLGTNTAFYTKVFNKVYLLDGSNVIASQDLNTSTVTRETGSPDRFTITLTGLNFVVSKDTTKALTVAFDVNPTVSSTYQGSYTVIIPADGVRAMDGAGIDQYGPTSQFSLAQTVSTSLVDTAQLQLSTNSNTVKANEVVAADGTSNNEKDKLALASVDLYAQKDNVLVRTWVVRVSKTGSGAAVPTTAWLMDGSTPVSSASISGGLATFTNLSLSIPKDTTKTYTIAADIRSANGTAATIAASTTAADISAENSLGSTVTAGTYLTGSATGQSQIVRNIGPVFSLTSKSIVKSATSQTNNTSTSTATATFTLNVQAVGGDILFGAAGSSTPMFNNSSFVTYLNGTATTLLVSSSTAYDTPTSGVVTSTNSFTVQRNNTISLPVSFLFEGKTATGANVSTGTYGVNLAAINWVSSNGAASSTFMAGNTDWRTSTVSLP